MAFVVVYDACVLHPAPLRDLLVRIAGAGIVRARWTERILDEYFETDTFSRRQFEGGAQAIVTFNLRDFPADALAEFDVEAKHPDDFVLESIDIAPGLVSQIVSQQAADLCRPPRMVSELLEALSALVPFQLNPPKAMQPAILEVATLQVTSLRRSKLERH